MPTFPSRLRVRWLVGVLAISATLMLAGTAIATDQSSNFVPTPLSRGTLSESVHFNTDAVKFQTKGPMDVVTATVTFGLPNCSDSTSPTCAASSGWHAHPGVVLVTVKSGSVVRYEANCSSTVYAAGSTFVESGDVAGLVRNESATTPAVVYVTYLIPVGAATKIDLPNPGCSQF